jgi:cardiolipin synthase
MTLPGILSSLVLIAGFLLAVVTLAHLLRQRYTPQSTVAWALAIVLIPYVGVPAYLLLAGRKRQRMIARKPKVRLSQHALQTRHAWDHIEQLLRARDVPPATTGNRLTLSRDGEESYRQLIEVVAGARESLGVTLFILHGDATGLAFIDALIERARAGVAVRLLLDDVGCMRLPQSALRPLLAAGGEVARFMPVWHLRLRRRLDLRNHRKIVVADQQRVWGGGANVGAEYMGPYPSPQRWRDMTFVVEGPAVGPYAELFRQDWEFSSEKTLPPAPDPPGPAPGVAADGGATLQVVPAGPDVAGDPLYDTILAAIFGVRRRLWLVTPYFVPDETLATALALTARRGVDVRIVMPRRSNHPITDLVRGTHLRELQAAGATVHLYGAGMMHAKAMLVDDDLALLGTANFDVRSLFLNYEVGLLVHSAEEVAAVEAWINALLRNTTAGVADVGAARDLVEGVARMAAPLL